MLTSRLLLHFKRAIEATFPVTEWRLIGERAWPLVWISMAGVLRRDDAPTLAHYSPGYAGEETAARLAARSPARAAVSPAMRVAASDVSHFAGHAPKFVVYGLPVQHHLRRAAGFYAPMIDPAIDAGRRIGATLKLEWLVPDSHARQPRTHPALGVINHFHSLEPRDIDAAELARIEKSLADIVAFAASEFAYDIGDSYRQAIMDALLVTAQSAANVRKDAEALFRADRPGVLYLSCYHHAVAWGMMLAARAAGAVTLDMQHGTTGENHFAYCDWTAVPTQGYALLPDIFLCWDERSAHHVLRAFPANGQPHRVAVVGRPDFDRGSAPEDWTRAEEAARSAAPGAEQRILITLSSAADGGLSPLMIDAMREAPKSWRWLIRCHLAALDPSLRPEGVASALAAAGVDNAETKLATSTPLAALLPHCAHHLTAFSSAALDALYFNVPTTFTSRLAGETLGDLIDDRLAAFADTADGVIEAISDNAAQRARIAEEAPITKDRSRLDALFASLVRR